MCSQAQHTLSSQQLPLKLQRIIITSCSGCWLASSANKLPDTPSSREATAGSWQQQILRRNCPHPWKQREQPVSLLAPRGQCLPALLALPYPKVAFIVNRKPPPATALALLAASVLGHLKQDGSPRPNAGRQQQEEPRLPVGVSAGALCEHEQRDQIGVGNVHCPSASRRQKAN